MAHWSSVWDTFGPFPPTRLPGEPRPTTDALGRVWHRSIPSADVERTRRAFMGGHLSLSALSSAAVVAALRDVTGQPECGLIHSASRRYVPGAEDVIGYLNHRILLRVPTPSTATFQDIAAQTRSAMLRSFEHDMMPFEFLLDRLAPAFIDRRPDRPYVHLNVERPPTAPQLPGLTVSFEWPPQDATHSDLPWISVDLDDRGDAFVLTAGYSTAAHDPATVTTLMGRVSDHLTSTA
jgi:hypothetical protein